MEMMRGMATAVMALFFAVVCTQAGAGLLGEKKSVSGGNEGKAPVTIDMFVMSQCPFATAAEGTMKQLKDKFGEGVAVNLYYVASGKEDRKAEMKGPEKEDANAPEFNSLHGKPEVEEDMRQLLIKKYYPEKFWEYLSSRNTGYQSPEWKKHALLAGIEPSKIEERITQGEGSDLLRENIKRARELQVQSSPTIYINDKPFKGNRDLASLSVLVNGYFKGTEREVKGLPECFSDEECVAEGKAGRCVDGGTPKARCEFSDLPEVKLTVLESAEHDIKEEPFIADLKERLGGIKEEKLDYGTPEGKKVVSEMGITKLPAYIFSKGIEKTKDFEGMSRSGFIEKKGEGYVVSSKGGGDAYYFDREQMPKRLDVFVMSQCPFGPEVANQLFKARSEGKMDKDINIGVHYILQERRLPDKLVTEMAKTDVHDMEKGQVVMYSSLHGQGELEEDIRQLCILKYWPGRFVDYLREKSKDLKSSLWEGAAVESRIDPGMLNTCVYVEGKDLLLKNIAFFKDLDASASPTFLWENKYLFTRPDMFKKLKGLENVDIKLRGSCSGAGREG